MWLFSGVFSTVLGGGLLLVSAVLAASLRAGMTAPFAFTHTELLPKCRHEKPPLAEIIHVSHRTVKGSLVLGEGAVDADAVWEGYWFGASALTARLRVPPGRQTHACGVAAPRF